MRVLAGDPAEWSLPSLSSAVTIGVFDGVHTGHRHVFELLRTLAVERGLRPVVMTFDPHPLAIVAPQSAPRMLTTLDQRLELFEAMGIELAAVLAFSERIRGLSPSAFVTEILAEGLGAKLVAVGEDFRFGRNRTGNVESLTEMGEGSGFETVIVPLVGGDEPVSSTRIRRLLGEGDVARAAVLLGRDHELRGTVVRGDGRGSAIGVPTANLELPEGMAVPARGVYAVRAGLDGALYPGVANIGIRPTFGGGSETLEVHLLEGGAEFYGREMVVRFVARVRDERRFDGVDELVAQIRRDIETARALLSD